jgi:hypothetical protein
MFMKKVQFILLCAITTPLASYAAGEGRLFIAAGKMFQSVGALVVYGVIAGALLGFLIARKMKPSRKKSSRNRQMPMQQDATPQPWHVSGGTKDLEKEKAELTLELKKVESERDEFKRRLTETEYLLKGPQAELKQQVKNPGVQTLYYLQPTTDGLFKVSGNVKHAAEALYQLSCNSASEATIRFIDTAENVSYAVQNEVSWILSACERSNISTANTYSIRTDVPGRAILRGDDWEIVQKAKITYIG